MYDRIEAYCLVYLYVGGVRLPEWAGLGVCVCFKPLGALLLIKDSLRPHPCRVAE